MQLKIEDITPALMIINEEYWIHYVLRDLLKMFNRVVVLDTGSKDFTKEVIAATVKQVGGNLALMSVDYKGDASRIGNGRNIMRQSVDTHWMLLVDGDEIWQEPQLRRMLEFEVPNDTEVVMVGAKQVEDVDGRLMLRTKDLANRDGLFAPGVVWAKTGYPFEGHDLHGKLAAGTVKYLPAPEVFEYHVRHTIRSPLDARTLARNGKKGYFPYKGPFEPMPKDWPGERFQGCTNPYLK